MDALGPQFQGLTMEEVGRRIGEELVAGGETPFWDALIPVLVQDHRGDPSTESDAVVVAHTGVATDAPTRMFFDGLYAGLAGSGVPVVGIEGPTSALPESPSTRQTASPAWTRSTRRSGSSRSRCSSPVGQRSLRAEDVGRRRDDAGADRASPLAPIGG